MDLYCERCGPEFWAEPLNAWSNLSFLIAAFASYRTATRREIFSGEIAVLVSLAAIVGVGSFLFHTFATVWAMWLDVIPILLLQLVFVWVYTRKQMGCSQPVAWGVMLGLVTLSLGGLSLRDVLNGSMMYLPAWLLLGVFGFHALTTSQHQPWLLLAATVTLFLALVFRTIDLAVCDAFPYGTHFLWHLFNGLTVFLVIQSLIVNQRNETVNPPGTS